MEIPGTSVNLRNFQFKLGELRNGDLLLILGEYEIQTRLLRQERELLSKDGEEKWIEQSKILLASKYSQR